MSRKFECVQKNYIPTSKDEGKEDKGSVFSREDGTDGGQERKRR